MNILNIIGIKKQKHIQTINRHIKAAGLGIILWILIFFEVSVLMFGFQLTSPNLNYYLIHGIFTTIFYIVLSFIYFRGKKIKKGFEGGLLLGFSWLIVSVVLDTLITIPLFVKSYGFLLMPEILISELWMIIVCVIMGMRKM